MRRYAKWAGRMGYLDPSSDLPKLENLQIELPAPYHKSNISSVKPYRDIVKAFLDQGVEMVAIHNWLKRNHGYAGSYTSVMRFVAGLLSKQSTVVVRIETVQGGAGGFRLWHGILIPG